MAQYLNPFPSGYLTMNSDGTNTVVPHTYTTTQNDKLNEMILHTTTKGDAAPIHHTPEQVEDRNRQWLLTYHPKYIKTKESFTMMVNKKIINYIFYIILLVLLVLILLKNIV
jgi:hypothetical protein